MKYLIEAKELIELQNKDIDLVILDCRFALLDKNYGEKVYAQEHIKGAYLIKISEALTKEAEIHGGFNPLKDPEDLVKILEDYGISNDTIVVAYDEGDFNGPSRLLFQMLELGLQNIYILNGGIEAYKAEGGLVDNITPEKRFNGKIIPKIDRSMEVDINYIKRKQFNPSTIIIDSRSHDRYLGINEPLYKKPGHIPGAKSYDCHEVLDGSFLKNINQLEEHFKNLKNYKEVILYCGSGISACVNSFALRQLDIDHKLYIGSFSDWISYEDNPVSTIEE